MVVRGGRWWWAAVFVCRSGTFRSSRRGAVGGRAGLRTGSGCPPGLRAPVSLQCEEGVRDGRSRQVLEVPARREVEGLGNVEGLRRLLSILVSERLGRSEEHT